MSTQLGSGCFFEDIANDAFSSTASSIWQLFGSQEVKGAGKNSRYLIPVLKEPNSSITVLPDVIDDMIGRKRVWERLFGNAVMPVVENGSVEKSYGILDGCFHALNLSGQGVLEVLKKAKK